MMPINDYLNALEELSRLREENGALQQRIKSLESENRRFKEQLIKSAEEIGRLTSENNYTKESGEEKKTDDSQLFSHVMYRRGRPPVSDLIKKEIIELRAGGYSIRRIADHIGLSYGVCQKIIKENK